MKMPKCPAVSKMITPKMVPTPPIPTPLWDQKWKAVLEQLLESPQTVAKEMGNVKYDMDVGNANNDKQQSTLTAEVDKEGGCDGFALQGRASSTFDFDEKNEDSDLVMGEGGSKDIFGGMQNMGNSFSFFGVGDCKEVDGQTK